MRPHWLFCSLPIRRSRPAACPNDHGAWPGVPYQHHGSSHSPPLCAGTQCFGGSRRRRDCGCAGQFSSLHRPRPMKNRRRQRLPPGRLPSICRLNLKSRSRPVADDTGPRWHRDLRRWYSSDQVRQLVDDAKLIGTISKPARNPGVYKSGLGRSGRQRRPAAIG